MDGFFQNIPLLYWIILLGFIGLCVGSFLNVVISRLPKMIMDEQYTGSLSVPGSHCPQCGVSIAWFHNMPVISYCLLKGRCVACQASISWQYPCVEVVASLLAVGLVLMLGLSGSTLLILIYCWFLLALFVIDMNTYLLPDALTLSLLWLGLIVNSFNTFVPLTDAVYAAVLGYMIFWVVATGYRFFL